jgi:uroporphyrin-III C-methyltransferase
MSGPTGRVYLVGAGPGAADLITVRAARLLGAADIVFHDALVPAEMLGLAPTAIKVAVGKRCGRHSSAQHFINKQLLDAAHRHRTVIRLKGGDPMIFGRSQEEIDALRAAGIDVEIVPGVTAASAAAAQAQVSLTQRGESRSVTLATPRVGADKTPTEWTAALHPAETAAIYMGAQEAGKVRDALVLRGFDGATPTVIVESASLPHARVIAGRLDDLPDMAGRLGPGPALILVGRGMARTPALERPLDADDRDAAGPDAAVTAARRPS